MSATSATALPPIFIEAAAKLVGTRRVRPQAVYSNLTWQIPFDQGAGHTDVPAFRGIDRTRYSIWLLHAMGHPGLFEAERIRIATAVSWFYRGPAARPRGCDLQHRDHG